ncbi:C2 domain protein [Necator americanus]|uniref:C2 domain protein n=1 Tax=Necator americanus TaxID=51031 RepID=W2SK98_NECAM|nr:C2 domain protein [Necator americanus]ETN69983.1 C2 domain protein [Necator americanus]
MFDFNKMPLMKENPMANAFLPAQPCSRIYLTIKAKKLKDKDTFSKSDPLCVVYQYTKNPDRNGEWTELGRTEVVWNCLNPEFATKILCDYLFEERQMVKFELYDVDSKSSDLSKHDFLGYMECHLAEIVGARIFTKELGAALLEALLFSVGVVAPISLRPQFEQIKFAIYNL